MKTARIEGADGVMLNVAIAGSGPAIVLLHRFPQTRLMWRHVAGALADEHTGICPDLRGYGGSDKPEQAGAYPKRETARDVIAVSERLGFEAQPPGLPERMIAASADEFFGHFLDLWALDRHAMPPGIRAHYLEASRNAVPSIVADCRASAGVDVEHDRTDREQGNTGDAGHRPAAGLGAALGFDAAALGQAWAPDLVHESVPDGHFMAEEAPEAVVNAVRSLLLR